MERINILLCKEQKTKNKKQNKKTKKQKCRIYPEVETENESIQQKTVYTIEILIHVEQSLSMRKIWCVLCKVSHCLLPIF